MSLKPPSDFDMSDSGNLLLHKKQTVKTYAKDLKSLAKEYGKMAGIVDNLNEDMVEYLYQIAIQTDELHMKLNQEPVHTPEA